MSKYVYIISIQHRISREGAHECSSMNMPNLSTHNCVQWIIIHYWKYN
jgi:hypothetical protein